MFLKIAYKSLVDRKVSVFMTLMALIVSIRALRTSSRCRRTCFAAPTLMVLRVVCCYR